MDTYKELTPREIIRWLTLLPGMITKAARDAETKRALLDHSKRELKVTEAKQYFIIEATYKEKQTAQRMNMLVDSNVDVDKARIIVIEAESIYRQAEIDLEGLSNRFVSLRKIASIREQELKAIPE